MTTFDDRQKAHERKYVLDEELAFKATARRNKLLGLWVAEKLGKTGPDADAYAKDVVAADFEEHGDDDVLKKVLADLTAANVVMAREDLRAEMDRLLLVAKQQVMQEKA